MEVSEKDLRRILTQKFIRVVLKDGTVHTGYIGNPEDFRDAMPETMVLVNGLMRDQITIADVADVSFPDRKESTDIPIFDPDAVRKYNRNK
jgi:hypothetical protein